MSDLPILFSAPMVRAILREIEKPGTGKTQTRCVLTADCDEPPAIAYDGRIIAYDDGEREYRWPRTYAVGDRLYVREAWRSEAAYDDLAPASMGGEEPIRYEADGSHQSWGYPAISNLGRYRQGMHMPRWASRITLIVADVRVRRLQEISEPDALAEGVERLHDGFFPYGITTFMTTVVDGREVPAQYCPTACGSFRLLWNSLNADRGYGWDANPWVAAYTFRPILGNIDQVRS